jgi:RNA polymerase sigma factor (sigma-70 family)
VPELSHGILSCRLVSLGTEPQLQTRTHIAPRARSAFLSRQQQDSWYFGAQTAQQSSVARYHIGRYKKRGERDAVMQRFTPEPTIDDYTLLRAWGEGERAAAERLFERHVSAVRRFFANKVDDPADLVQTTFLACLESSAKFRGSSSFRTYLLSIARFQLYHHYRTRGMQERKRLATSVSVDVGPSPSTLFSRAMRDHALLVALRSIPLPLQVILELAYWEDLSGEELSEILEIPLNTVYTRLHRAKQKLREALARAERDATRR